MPDAQKPRALIRRAAAVMSGTREIRGIEFPIRLQRPPP